MYDKNRDLPVIKQSSSYVISNKRFRSYKLNLRRLASEKTGMQLLWIQNKYVGKVFFIEK